MIEMLIAALEAAKWMLYEKLCEVVYTHWENVEPSLNPGQNAIYWNHMTWPIEEWVGEAGENWPDADADMYSDSLFTAYDGEVMERAFSDAITRPLDTMWTIIYKAQEIQQLIDILEAMADASPL